MCRICERWDSRDGSNPGASATTSAPLAVPGTELPSAATPYGHPPHSHQPDEAATTFRWSATGTVGEERTDPQPDPGTQVPAGQTRETAISLGYLTRVSEFRTRTGTVNREGSVFYRFKLSAPRRLRIELRNLSSDADLFLLNAAGTQITESRLDGTLVDSLLHDLDRGTYYIRVDAFAGRAVDYQLRYRAEAIARTPETAISLGDLTGVTAFRTRRSTLLNPTFNRVNPVYFRFTLRASRVVRVEMRDLAGNLLNGNETLALRDSLGDSRRGPSNRFGEKLFGEDTLVQWLVPGTYYLSVDSYGGQTTDFQIRYRTETARGTRGKTYGTSWNLGDLTDSTAYRVRTGTAREEVRGRGGDYRRFTLTRWRVVGFALRNLSRAGMVRVSLLDLYEQRISDVRAGDGRGYLTENSLLRDLRPGTYFIHVDDISFGASRNPRYQLRYRREPTPPRGASHATAWYIGNLTRAGGKFRNKYATVHQGNRYGERDTDYRRFTLTETRTMRIELRRISFTARDGFFAGIHLGVEDAHGRSVEDDLPFSGTRGHMTTYQSRLGPGTYYIWVRGGHLLGESETIRYHLRYRTLPESGASGQSLWRDDTVSAGSASRLDERRSLANPGGMLSA